MLKKCFGIISWLPDKNPDRKLREDRVNRLFSQLNNLWPDIDILVIAQNWQDFKPIETKNNKIILNYKPLGILQARKTLRREFLKLDYDYIIMFDDDAIIKCDNDHAHIDFMNEVDAHPDGFCFIHGNNSRYHPYIAAQLNLCAISRFIYEKEDIVNVDPQKREGYEDSIYACLLHNKWGKYEFNPPKTIRPIQFNNPNEKAPSTWYGNARAKGSLGHMNRNTDRIQEYIVAHKELPDNLSDYLEVPPAKQDPRQGPRAYNSYIDLFI